jgi:hypothetical protein
VSCKSCKTSVAGLRRHVPRIRIFVPPANNAGGRAQEICGLGSHRQSEPAGVKLNPGWDKRSRASRELSRRFYHDRVVFACIGKDKLQISHGLSEFVLQICILDFSVRSSSSLAASLPQRPRPACAVRNVTRLIEAWKSIYSFSVNEVRRNKPNQSCYILPFAERSTRSDEVEDRSCSAES